MRAKDIDTRTKQLKDLPPLPTIVILQSKRLAATVSFLLNCLTMKIMRIKKWKTLDLFLVLIISLAFTLFCIAINLNDTIYKLFYDQSSMTVAQPLINFTFLWLLGTIWITYRRWRKAEEKQKELNDIISRLSPDKKHSSLLEEMEKKHRGITKVKRDEDGNVLFEDVDFDDII